MRVDVYLVVGGDAGLLNRERERAGRALRLGVRGGDVICVAGVAVADELSVDFGVTRQRVFVFLQKQHAGALAHDEAAALRVEGDGGAVGSLLSQSAIELVNPAMASGQTVASLPPARMASA